MHYWGALSFHCLGCTEARIPSAQLHISTLFSLAVCQPGTKYLLASSFLLPQYNEVLSWAELPVLLSLRASKQQPHAGPREVRREEAACRSLHGIGCSLTHHFRGWPITRATASLLPHHLSLQKPQNFPPQSELGGEAPSLCPTPKRLWGEVPCSQPQGDECSASQRETIALWGEFS